MAEPVRRRGGLGAETGMLGALDEKQFIATSHGPAEPAPQEAPPKRTAEQVDPEKADQIALEALGEGVEEKPAPTEADKSVEEKPAPAGKPTEASKSVEEKPAPAEEPAEGDKSDEGPDKT
jgi:hypothetical protein